ncbi:putative receptor-like serine/threonine-protein kinase At4g34500 [Bidens hawaiensis]|uniref:putative receptor-like serine/threonine-protein kinase At4g34500 n=1 Tax=Bidens hawaiensis TaxID=980011 RepID=UPI00404B6B49
MSNLNLEYSSVRTKLEHIVFPLEDIVTATHNFAEENLLKRGKVVDVYKGKLLRFNECINVVIRRFINQKYEKIRNKFYVEIEMLSRCKHPNLLTLLGFCDEDSEMILVFEGDFEGALDRYLGRTGEMANFTWEQRIRICLDVANGLKYLLDNMDDKSSMIYEELQSANILLDKNWTAKIANFGIAKFMDDKSSMIHQGIQSENGLLDINLYTKIADFRITKFKDKNNIGGTYMYLDSNHVMMHRESNHVYSLGVILSEILTGKLADAKGPNNFNLRRRGFNVGKQKGIADPNIMEEVQECSLRKGPNQDSLDTFFKITNQCLAYAPSERPTLGVVIDSLEKSLHFQVSKCFKLKSS